MSIQGRLRKQRRNTMMSIQGRLRIKGRITIVKREKNGRTCHCKNASIFSKEKSCGVPFTHAYAVIEQVLEMG